MSKSTAQGKCINTGRATLVAAAEGSTAAAKAATYTSLFTTSSTTVDCFATVHLPAADNPLFLDLVHITILGSMKFTASGTNQSWTATATA